MKLCIAGQDVSFALTDFNRLRWTLSAIRHNAALVDLFGCPVQLVTDSTAILAAGGQLPGGVQNALVVLWDGLNSRLEIDDTSADWGKGVNVTLLPVGLIEETAGAFAAPVVPLFPQSFSDFKPNHISLGGSLGIDLRGQARAALRPLMNMRSAPRTHSLLTKGGKIVFCGLVAPTQDVLKNFLRGSSSQALASAGERMVDFAWRDHSVELKGLAFDVWTRLREMPVRGAADYSAVYSLAATLHRIVVLGLLARQTTQLVVNEFGRQPFFDPYDAWGYRRNLFLDFGSTRGPDLVYPRSLDMRLQRKVAVPLRFLPPGGTLAKALTNQAAEDFWALCEQQAATVLKTDPLRAA